MDLKVSDARAASIRKAHESSRVILDLLEDREALLKEIERLTVEVDARETVLGAVARGAAIVDADEHDRHL